MKKYSVIALVVSTLCVVLFYKMCSFKKAEDTLIVGMMSGWAPFMIITNDGIYEGFDVDVAKEIAHRMNKKIVIEDMGSLASCFVVLDQQGVDMVMSGLDITQKRRDMLNMVYYTGENVKQFDLVFWKEIPHNVTSMEDVRLFSQAIICAESGSAQEKFLDNYDFVAKKRMNSVTDIVLDLQFGKSFAAILEPRVAARLQRQCPEIKRLPVDLPENFQVFGCGIAINQNNQQLASTVEAIVHSMIADKTMKQLEIKWQLEE